MTLLLTLAAVALGGPALSLGLLVGARPSPHPEVRP